MDQASVMLNLMAFERFGDYAAARDIINGFLTRYTDFPLPPSSGASGAYLECLEGVAAKLGRFGFLQGATTGRFTGTPPDAYAAGLF